MQYDERGVQFKVMRECKACLASTYAGKASLALPALFQIPSDVRITFERTPVKAW